MDILTKEIAQKRAALLQASADKPKKYRRRSELESAPEPKPDPAPEQPSEEPTSCDHSKQPPNESAVDQDVNESKALPYTHEEICKALRAFAVPILFFGETLSDQLTRLRKLQLEAHDREHGSAAGKHDNLQRAIEKEIESEMVAAHVKKDFNPNHDNHKSSSLDKYREQKTRDQFDNVEDYVLYFFKRLLLLWEQELKERPDDVKRSVKGKKAAATQKQTHLYIKPLFKLLKARETPTDILNDITIIVDMAIQREYVKANDHYLRMSIGNAPWPMGVTMVGIHERKGREKIFSQSIAHVLNDETQRKYIQSIKRLLTYGQTIHPNPSNTKNVG